MIPTAILKVKLISTTTAKPGINSVKSSKSILEIGAVIRIPTTISAGL